MNIDKQIDYWCTGSDEDWEVAEGLVANGKIRHGLFFLHLSMEKVFKAHICRVTGEHPPKIHNLLTLMERSELPVSKEWAELLGIMNQFCMIGRYPNDPFVDSIPAHNAMGYVHNAREIRKWLLQKLFRS